MEAVTVALRALVERETERPTAKRSRQQVGWPRCVLIFDTETTTDAAQQLNFGVYRYGRWQRDGRLDIREEGLFYADNLPSRDPKGYSVLRAYSKAPPAEEASGPRGSLPLRSRTEFVARVFWRAVQADALIVGYNLPFDLSRLALETSEARGWYRGGFSLTTYQPPDGGEGARLRIKSIDSARAFIGFSGIRGRRGYSGHFLDLKALALALTGEKHSLASAGEAFAVVHGKLGQQRHGIIRPAYVDYSRRDGLASQELLEKLRAEFDRHPVVLDPWEALSPASLAKGYLKVMGVSVPSGLPDEIRGAAMLAYYGGRAEARVRRTAVPVVHTDFTSMYPTVNTLMGHWRLLTANGVEVADATAEIQELLRTVTLQQCFDPTFWRKLSCLVLLQPDGDILPVRARYGVGEEFTIGINPFQSDRGHWYACPDAVASKLLSGRVPTILRAVRLVPRGHQQELRVVKIRGQMAVDPRTEDFFQRVVELRKRTQHETSLTEEERHRLALALKIVANSGSYGIFAELKREDLPRGKRTSVRVHGLQGAFARRISAPENPGPFFCPPLAALITAGARLMLALLERCVTDAGGTYAFVDTDSMSIVANRRGGLVAPGIRALSWSQVDGIVQRFAPLNPYSRKVVPHSILEVKEVNFDADGHQREVWCYAISAKRYTFYRRTGRDQVEIIEPSEHGLGHLMSPSGPDAPDPKRWMADSWEWIVRTALHLRVQRPRWWDRPAVGRISITSPLVYGPFARAQASTPYADRVKPFNFLLTAQVTPFGHPVGIDPQRFHLVQPYSTDPTRWADHPWVDIYSGDLYRIATGVTLDPMVVGVKTYGDVLEEYATHPEPKSGDPRGGPCTRLSTGLLTRRPVRATELVYIGKEANRLEEVDAGLIHAYEDVQNVYRDPDDDLADVLPVLRVAPQREVAAVAGVTSRTVRSWLNGHTVPPVRRRAKLVGLAIPLARRLVRLKSADPDLRAYAERLLARKKGARTV